MMLFRKAQENESEKILNVYHSVIGSQFCAWNNLYPSEYEICADMEAGTLYVIENQNAIISAISVVPENELDGFDCWEEKENAREFARVAVMPDCQGKGIAGILVSKIEKILKSQCIGAIHISVAKKNIPAQKLYQSHGFSIRGEAEMYGNSFWLFEKLL